MKLLLNSIIKCFFYSKYSKYLLLDNNDDDIKPFLKSLNKKLFKENYILFIADMIKKLDKSLLSLTKYKDKYYLRKINKKLKTPDFLLIDNDNIIIDLIKKISAFEKKFNITSKIVINDKNETDILFNGSNYKLDSYITDDNSYYITKNDKLSLKQIKNFKLLIYVLNTDKSLSSSSSSSRTSNNSNNSYIKKIKKIIKKKQEEVKFIEDKKIIIKLKNDIKQYNDILVRLKSKLTKKDYISLIKKKYPYYVYLDKYSLQQLKYIYNRKCNNIDIYYDGKNSCYIDSLMVALFNKKNVNIEELLFNADVKNYNNDSLTKLGTNIKKELLKLYKKISFQDVNEDINKCTNLRKLFQEYFKIYKKKN